MATSTMAAPTVQTQSMVGGGEVGRMRVVLALRQSLERRYMADMVLAGWAHHGVMIILS